MLGVGSLRLSFLRLLGLCTLHVMEYSDWVQFVHLIIIELLSNIFVTRLIVFLIITWSYSPLQIPSRGPVWLWSGFGRTSRWGGPAEPRGTAGSFQPWHGTNPMVCSFAACWHPSVPFARSHSHPLWSREPPECSLCPQTAAWQLFPDLGQTAEQLSSWWPE